MRNRIKSVSKDKEEEIWVRIPTRMDAFDTMLKDIIIDNNQDWKTRHINAFRSSYGKGWEEISFLRDMYAKNWEKLAEFNMEFITNCCNYLNINTKLIRASDLRAGGKKDSLIFNICKELEATDYLTSVGARDYLEDNKEIFEKGNIKIHYHNYTHPVYKQRGEIFMPNLSVLDLLFNEKENAKNFI